MPESVDRSLRRKESFEMFNIYDLKQHISIEDDLVFPLAARLLSLADKAAIADEMVSRRTDQRQKPVHREGQLEMEMGPPSLPVDQFLWCRNSALRSAVSFTRKPIFGCDGSRSGVMPYSRRVSDVTGPIDPTTVRRNALAVF
jgi:hypothetical protein